jgi:hypothetical protein
MDDVQGRKEKTGLPSPQISNIMQHVRRFSATVFFHNKTGIRPRKYRNIMRGPGLARFQAFALRSHAWYFNLYDQDTGEYICRLYMVNTEDAK